MFPASVSSICVPPYQKRCALCSCKLPHACELGAAVCTRNILSVALGSAKRMDLRKVADAIALEPSFTETRKVSLYSNFGRLRDANYEGYRANCLAWESALIAATRNAAFPDKVVISAGPELVRACNDVDYGLPRALDVVFNEMIVNEQIFPVSVFLSAADPLLSRSWKLSDLARRIGRWAWYSLWDRGAGTKKKNGDLRREKYAVVTLLRDEGPKLLDKIKAASAGGYTSSIIPREFVNDITGNGLSSLDVDCLLAYLSRETELLNYTSGVVKIGDKVTGEDVAIAQMRLHERQLSMRCTAVAEKIDEANAKARAALKQSREAARKILCQRRILMNEHSHILGLIEQVQAVMVRIDAASTSRDTLAALMRGQSVLKVLNNSTTEERIAQSMDDLRDDLANADSLAKSLANITLDNVDVDEELEAMAIAEKSKAEAQQPAPEQQERNAKQLDVFTDLVAPKRTPKTVVVEKERQQLVG